MKTIQLNCTTCLKAFEKEKREHTRQLKKGRDKFFCSRTCAAVKNNEESPREGNVANLVANNRRDHLTPFKWFVYRGKYRSLSKKKYESNISAEYLQKIWLSQNGLCPFTGWELILPEKSDYPWSEKNTRNASLDRIDNSLGYIEGNVRFISVMANLARQTYTDDQLIEFCKAVAKNNS